MAMARPACCPRLRTVGEHQANEDHLAKASDGQHEWTHRRMERPIDQHGSYERDERTPVAHDDLRQGPLQRFPERGAKGGLRRHGSVNHRHVRSPDTSMTHFILVISQFIVSLRCAA